MWHYLKTRLSVSIFATISTAAGLAFFLSACSAHLPPEVHQAYQSLNRSLDFNLDIRPILSDKCFSCHGPDKAKLKAGLRLDQEQIAKGPLPENPGNRAIVAGNSKASVLTSRILADDPELMMPPQESNLNLSSSEKAALIKWIDQGAVYKPHWAFIPPQKSKIPDGKNPVDFFIAQRLHAEGLTSNTQTDRETLLRRVSFDLTGLPPSLEEMEAFLTDSSPEAYEKQVDRLLASPHYGERMATDWMDVARYADTHGYTVDRFRDVSPWRDWVIESFNANRPYDEFFTLQLAGDLLPAAGKKDKIATAFLRLHPQNMEGGIVPEEFRVEYVVDRTNTFSTAFMGLTMGCAKCHDHKFDPLSQKEYFQLFSFFNNLNEVGQISFDDMMPVPTLLMTDEKEDSIINYLGSKIDTLRLASEKNRSISHPDFDAWLNSGKYQEINVEISDQHLLGFFPLDRSLKNAHRIGKSGIMERNNSNDETPNFAAGYQAAGLLLDGDAWLNLGVGAFERYQPFTVGLWINVPEALKNGVIFHKGNGAVLYNFKGFHLALRDNHLELLMAHTAPYNAIMEYTKEEIPKNKWIYLTVTYDGSSKADGFKIFLNGGELITEIEIDNLYKGILFNVQQNEPGIQIGARWRGKGIGGASVDNIVVYDQNLSALEVLQLADTNAFQHLIQKKINELDPREKTLLFEYYRDHYDAQYKASRSALLALQKERSGFVDTIPELMIYDEMPQPRTAYVLDRGAYDSPTDPVSPNTPKAILAIDHSSETLNRLDLAHWLADPAHPLTARVMVNRLWQQFFGKGLVATSEDFGSQGRYPTHPKLLDHLAVIFKEDWNIKRLQKLLVMSETYRRSSLATSEMVERDPKNLLFARGPSRRLSAEMLRDQALAASGLLETRIGGKSVMPYQPEGLWKVNGASYTPSVGKDLYRRSLYTIWKRSVPHPTQSTFDAPERSECVMRRQETNTPLQALVLMNDPIFVEAAKEIGKEMAGNNDIVAAFRRLTGRFPAPAETAVLEDLYHLELAKYAAEPKRAAGWKSETDHHPDIFRMAAYSVVASTIINSDAFITKR